MNNNNIVLVGINDKVHQSIPKVDGEIFNYPFPRIPSKGEEILLLEASPALHLIVDHIRYDFSEDGHFMRAVVAVDYRNS